ncbi:MAG: IclR family transcriptional regulator [Haloarculaceae archaeon]
MAQRTDNESLSTTQTSLQIIESLMELDGARVTELADEIDRPASTVHNHLCTLVNEGYVVKDADFYYLSLRFLQLGYYVENRKREYQLASQYVDKLNEQTGLRSLFAVEEHGRVVIMHTRSGDHASWKHEERGNRLYLHNTAVGKAILAEFDRDRVEECLDRWDMPEMTDQTIGDREALFDELETVKERGYAFNRQENIEGLLAVATAVKDSVGNVVGAFSVSGAAEGIHEERFQNELPDVLLSVSNEYELDLSLS